MIRILTLLICLTLAACAAPQRPVAEGEADPRAVAGHQAQLEGIQVWEFQARMAFFNLRENERHGASVRWQHTPESLHIRISHPLRGTLARLEQQPGLATLTDNQDNVFYASDASALLSEYLNMYLPVALINDALLGRHPAVELIKPRYYADGSLASYEVDASEAGIAPDRWQIELSNYSTAQNHPAILPHSLELESADYRIRLNISRWFIGTLETSDD